MNEVEIVSALAVFAAGAVVGVLATLLFNKVRSGSISAAQVKKEKDAYQVQVEAHFEETSRKFRDMAAQYQDLYQHLAVGATTLCRPDKIAPGLSDTGALTAIATGSSTAGDSEKRTAVNPEAANSKKSAPAAKASAGNPPDAVKPGAKRPDTKEPGTKGSDAAKPAPVKTDAVKKPGGQQPSSRDTSKTTKQS